MLTPLEVASNTCRLEGGENIYISTPIVNPGEFPAVYRQREAKRDAAHLHLHTKPILSERQMMPIVQ